MPVTGGRDGAEQLQAGQEDSTVVHRNEVKEQHTTHWDLDVMTDEQLDRVYARERAQVRRRQLLRHPAAWTGAVVMLLLLMTAGGWLLL
ncbi:MAG: hypothetical protein VX549_10885 [Pseudomonadota bacterium]|nr:hypothetical protein [Pseudomonadota bacterium]